MMRLDLSLYRFKLIIALFVSVLPFNLCRCFLYSKFFGYDINESKIGWLTIIVVNDASLFKCSISRFNKFIGPMDIQIKDSASIGCCNNFNCGLWSSDDKFEKENYQRKLVLGSNIRISNKNYFDIVGSFILDDDAWIGGFGSQFWTHGAGVKDRDIKIGKNCYIGSSVKFTPGSQVGDNCIVGMGSVMTKKFNVKNSILAGVPAKIIKSNYDWRSQTDLD